MTAPRARPPENHPAPGGDDAARWRDAAQLRRDHPGWIIVWLAADGEFHAYRRLPGTRRDAALAAPATEILAGLIEQAEQATRHPKDAT